MKPKNKVLSLILSSVLGCTLALLLASCQSSQTSSSSSSSSSVPTAQPTPPSPTASSAPSSDASRKNTEQQSSAEQQPEGEEEPGMPSGGNVLSEEEAVVVLDEQFDESMAVFDGMIVNERAAAQAIESGFPEEGNLGNDSPLYEEADISEDSDSAGGLAGDIEEPGGNGSVFSDTQGDRGTSTASNGGNVPSTQSGARAPTDIPDGRDDDIVARQIREAALKEQDPVLREKLWEEYRKYKKGQ